MISKVSFTYLIVFSSAYSKLTVPSATQTPDLIIGLTGLFDIPPFLWWCLLMQLSWIQPVGYWEKPLAT